LVHGYYSSRLGERAKGRKTEKAHLVGSGGQDWWYWNYEGGGVIVCKGLRTVIVALYIL
jgi:hypothetical protein